MDKIFDITQPLVAAVSRMIQSFIEYLPQFVGGLLLLLIGWLAAKLFRALTIRLAGGMDRAWDILKLRKETSKETLSSSAVEIIGAVVFWVVLLFFVTAASNVFGFKMFAGWLDQLISHLPNVLAGALIVGAGFVLGNLARDGVVASMGTASPQQRDLFGRIVQVFIIILLVIVGVDQVGIDIYIVNTVVGIAFGGLLFGLALAFGLGFRTVASNLIATRYLKGDYEIGNLVRIGEIEGKIVDLTFTSVVLETTDGRMIVPARLFTEQVSLLLERNRSDG